MKANELMIGDYYQNSDGDICRVIKNFGSNVWGEGDDVTDDTDNPLPIPITEDILLANGWVDADPTLFHGYKYVFITGKKTTLTLNHWTDFYTFSVCHGDRPLNYVHELQHALRLCGLTELADNFKVK